MSTCPEHLDKSTSITAKLVVEVQVGERVSAYVMYVVAVYLHSFLIEYPGC